MPAALLLALVFGPPRPAAALTPVEREVVPVVDLFYDLRFSSATAAAEALERRHPGHPAGPFYLAVVDYQRFLAEEPKSTATLAAFEQQSDAALSEAEAWESTSTAEGLYYVGVTRGFRARVLAAQKRYFKALPEALRAVKSLKAALAIDPGLEDAYLGLGMYEYFAARMPPAAKPFAYLVGAGWGDKDKGIADLQRAATRGGPAKMEARSVLSSVYALEGRWEDSAKLLTELTARYPRNPLYRLRLVYVLERAGRWDEAARCADPNGGWLSALPPAFRPIAEPPARYRLAEIALLRGDVAAAKAQLALLDAARLPEGLAAFAEVRRANVLDAEGKRKDAARLYKSVRHKEAAKLAKGFLETPYPGGPKDVMPWLGLETPR